MASRKKAEFCGNCRFFVPDAEIEVEKDAEGNEVISEEVEGGFCHRKAPHCVMSGLMYEDGVDTVWPWVSAEDWCGEWEG